MRRRTALQKRFAPKLNSRLTSELGHLNDSQPTWRPAFVPPASSSRDFPKHCDALARRRNFSHSSRVARRVSGKQIFSGQAPRSADRRELNPTLAPLYKRVRSLLLLSRVPAMKAPSPSRSSWHRFSLLNVPRSNSRLISLPIFDDL